MLNLSVKRKEKDGVKFNLRLAFQILYQFFHVLLNLIIPELWTILRSANFHRIDFFAHIHTYTAKER